MERHFYPRTVVSVREHYKNQTKLVALVQSLHHHHHHLIKNVTCSRHDIYRWNIAPMALNNNYSLTHLLSFSCLYHFFKQYIYVFDTTLCFKVCLILVKVRWHFPNTMSFLTLELTATNIYLGSSIKLSRIRYFVVLSLYLDFKHNWNSEKIN